MNHDLEKIYIDTQGDCFLEVNAPKEITNELRKYFVTKISEQIKDSGYSFRFIENKDLDCYSFDSGEYEKINFYDNHEVFIKNDSELGENVEIIFDDAIKVVKDDSNINIYYANNDDFSLMVMKHVVRSAIDKLLLTNGYNLLHAGAFVLGDNVVMVLGEKGSGKTTTIVTSLDSFNAGYLSNDRVFAKISDEGLRLIEREADTKLDIKTVENSSLKDYLKDAKRDEKSGKYYFNNLHSQIGNGRVPSGIATHMILPNIRSENNDIESVPFSEENISESIIEDCPGFFMAKLLFGEIEQRELDYSNLNLECVQAFGIGGIRKAILKIINEIV